MKLNLSQRGTDCNVDVQALWEECQQEEIKVEVWRKWIQKKLIQNLVMTEEGKVLERLQKLDEKLGHSPSSSKGTLEEPPITQNDSLSEFTAK